MNFLTFPMGSLCGVLLPVAAGLLLEELTLGGLVKLLLAPRSKYVPHDADRGEATPRSRKPGTSAKHCKETIAAIGSEARREHESRAEARR
jgi:hypothetical protein